MKPQDQVEAKKPYQEPKLVAYGDIREITRSGQAFNVSDSGNDMMSPSHG